MAQLLKIAIWNANGLCQHAQEVKLFLQNNNIDVMLVSEAHFTLKSHLQIPRYQIYITRHPDGNAHGGTAIIIREGIKHHELEGYNMEHLQATTVALKDHMGTLNISAVYCPPKFNNKKKDYEHYFRTLGNKFITGGDWNAKHQHWGSRIATAKGKELYATLKANNLTAVSTGQPTYWPTDRRKIPDVIDFGIIKGINARQLKIESCLDLSSDHSPIIVTLHSYILEKQKQPTLYSKKTNWEVYRTTLDEIINLNVSLKTPEELNVVVTNFTKAIQNAAWIATPDHNQVTVKEKCPIVVKEKILEKRKLRKKWQITRTENDKKKFNKSAKELKQLLMQIKNQSIQEYLSSLSASEATDYSLWKATRKLKRPQVSLPPIKDQNDKWARSSTEKATAFANHLVKVFEPHNIDTAADHRREMQEFLNAPYQMDPPIKNISLTEIKDTILQHINPKKAPGFDLITGKVLQELTNRGFKAIQQIFNAVLRLGYFPSQWKVAQIIMLLKPGKNPNETVSYRPISLLPILSKVFEKIFLQRLKPILENNLLIPDHQFGFRSQHGTIEQVHRIVNIINKAFEKKMYCSAAFLDISQAFDKVWHEGLQYKLKQNLPYNFVTVIKSYLTERYFLVKYQDEYSNLLPIKSGVPQGSVLGPILYLLYTADLPTTSRTEVATYADDTAVLAVHANSTTASQYLQENLNKIQTWLVKWKIKANELKSIHVTFTLNRDTCPPVILNDRQLNQADDTKYLGMHMDRRLTWKKHIFTKRKQLGLKLRQMYWLIGRQSQLTMESKLLLYKAIIKPVWTYGIQLWGTASNSNLEILQRFQNKVLRTIVNAPWYVPNIVISRDLQIPSIKEEIKRFSEKYSARTEVHPNVLARNLFENSDEVQRLKRFKPNDLMDRFN